MDGRELARFVVAASLLGTMLSGCSGSSCNFQADGAKPAPDARGETTPRAALDTWLDGDHEGPSEGWKALPAKGNLGGVQFRNGHWIVGVIEAPAGGYLVSSVGCSTAG